MKGYSDPPEEPVQAEKLKWQPLPDNRPSTKAELLNLITELYWEGVAAEVKHIIITLSELHGEGGDVEQDWLSNPRIEGYESFVDQICTKDEIRRRIREYKQQTTGNVRTQGDARPPPKPLNKHLYGALAASLLQMEQQKQNSHSTKEFDRARMILQAAGFLDIDKLVGYRKPVSWHSLGIVSRGRPPQLTMTCTEKTLVPEFSTKRCSSCQNVLTGSMFECVETSCRDIAQRNIRSFFCETCFRDEKHPTNHLTKVPKYCILDEAVKSPVARQLCHCTTVSRHDSDGRTVNLWPIQAAHRGSGPSFRGRGSIARSRCSLVRIPGIAAATIAESLREPVEGTSKLDKVKITKRKNVSKKDAERRIYTSEDKFSEPLDAQIPLALRPFAPEFPIGNTHVALMFGPLIIENGVPDTKGGVLITTREPLNYYIPVAVEDISSTAVAVGHDRKVWTLDDYPRKQRRLKACMKQVVGRPFSEPTLSTGESAIIEQLLVDSRVKQTSIRSIRHFDDATIRLTQALQAIIGVQVTKYLEYFIEKLFEPSIKLTWSFWNNSCQEFCDAILQHKDFSTVFGPEEGSLPYLISFVVRLKTYHRAAIYTKYDVPNGLTEEYLASFRQGRHDDADIIDTLSEYWHYWGAFPNHLYPNQELFPWDCTEAYKPDAPVCNTCSLARHVWAFPFDSWSIIQLHLQKDRSWYPTPSSHTPRLPDNLWRENRMKLLVARNALLRGAVAMSSTLEIRTASQLTTTTNTDADLTLDRLKLGGIHRAQPFSHHFTKSESVYYLLAPWIHLPVAQRVTFYEELRNIRKERVDVASDDFDVRMLRADSTVEFLGGLAGGLLLWDFEGVGAGVDSVDPGTAVVGVASAVGSVGDWFNV